LKGDDHPSEGQCSTWIVPLLGPKPSFFPIAQALFPVSDQHQRSATSRESPFSNRTETSDDVHIKHDMSVNRGFLTQARMPHFLKHDCGLSALCLAFKSTRSVVALLHNYYIQVRFAFMLPVAGFVLEGFTASVGHQFGTSLRLPEGCLGRRPFILRTTGV
jgi:hypothetical protein